MRDRKANPMAILTQLDTDEVMIKVVDSYSIKDALKARGYHWDPMELAWSRIMPFDPDPDQEPNLAMGDEIV